MTNKKILIVIILEVEFKNKLYNYDIVISSMGNSETAEYKKKFREMSQK